jgi:molybdate transport system permease protein
MIDLQPLLLSFYLAAVTTVILLLVGVPLASMPLVLPPSVLGFYLLLAFSPQHAFGHWLEQYFNLRLVFSFGGLVIGSVIFSLPFMVQPIQAALQNLPASLLEASRTLGKADHVSFFRVQLPNIKPALLSAVVLTFAHIIGEFGVVLMLGGNIPGVTRVASIAIYDEVEALNYAAANVYALVLAGVTFALLLAVYGMNRRWVHRHD